MKVNVGDYVRTKYGITQYKEYDTQYGEKILAMPIRHLTEGFFANTQDVIKSSPSIIELLEENDLLEIEYYSPRYRKRLTRLFEVEYKSETYLTLKNAHCDFTLINNKFDNDGRRLKPIIKSIVTKEQFKSMKYEVGE